MHRFVLMTIRALCFAWVLAVTSPGLAQAPGLPALPGAGSAPANPGAAPAAASAQASTPSQSTAPAQPAAHAQSVTPAQAAAAAQSAATARAAPHAQSPTAVQPDAPEEATATAPPPSSPAVALAPPPSAAAPQTASSGLSPTYFWIAASTTIIVASLGGFQALHVRDLYDQARGLPAVSPEREPIHDKMKTAEVTADVLLVSSLALAIGTTILAFHIDWSGRDRPAEALARRPQPSAAGRSWW